MQRVKCSSLVNQQDKKVGRSMSFARALKVCVTEIGRNWVDKGKATRGHQTVISYGQYIDQGRSYLFAWQGCNSRGVLSAGSLIKMAHCIYNRIEIKRMSF